MSSNAEKGLARKLLSLKGRGSNVPNEVAAAARRVADGQARSGDIDLVRQHLGVGRSYAGNLRGVTGAASRWMSIGMNVSRDVESMSRGSSAAGVRAAAEVGLGVANEIVKNRRSLIKIGEGVAEAVGADPAIASKLFNSLSRIAKVGGVAGAAALAGFQVANGFFSAIEAGAKTVQKVQSAALKFGNRQLSAQLEETAFGMAKREALFGPSGLGDNGSDWNPFTYLDAFVRKRTEADAATKAEQMMRRAQQGRQLARGSAAASDEIAKAARRKGVAVDQLTAREINQALDSASGREIGYSRDEYFSFVASKQSDLIWWEKELMDRSPEYFASKYNEWGEELAQRTADRYARRLEDLAVAEQETLGRMPASARLRLVLERQEKDQGFSAYRSRHQPVVLD